MLKSISAIESLYCILFLSAACRCASKTVYGKSVGPYCDMWDNDGPWCYLAGGMEGKICKGAIKSDAGDFYWTKDSDICRAAENNRKASMQ